MKKFMKVILITIAVVLAIALAYFAYIMLSNYPIEYGLRRSLPIQTSIAKFLDLDRCASIARIPTANGQTLVLVNFHLSAYTWQDLRLHNRRLPCYRQY